MRKTILTSFFIALCIVAWPQGRTSVKEYNKMFTTYPFSDPNPIPNPLAKFYPYFRYDGFTGEAMQKEWKVVELENEYIKLAILPGIGGKIWSATEKKTGRDFIYHNHVVKFRDVSMRGPWTSGGIEPNYGVIGHTPNCATPVDYMTLQKGDGSASCFIGTLDLLTQTKWRLEINLPADKAYFTTRSFWYNASPTEQPYYTWMNAGIPARGNLEFIFPGTHYLDHNGESSDWPQNDENGKLISWYNQNDFGGYKSYHIVGSYADFFGGYWHDEDYGMARYSSRDDKPGKKIWIWGLSRQGMIWERLLTDHDGQYVEVQSGRLFNQSLPAGMYTPFKYRSFAPSETDQWTEYWFPVLQTKGLVKANESGALNVRNENGWLKINFSPVQNVNDELAVHTMSGNTHKHLTLKPLEPFADSIRIGANDTIWHVSIGSIISYGSMTNKEIELSRPIESPRDFDWNSIYGLYLAGKSFMDERMYHEAEEKIRACLKSDRNYCPALVALSELEYRKLNYNAAFDAASKAIAINSYDPAANYYYGLSAFMLGRSFDAKDGLDIASQSAEYRVAAFTRLGGIYFKEKNYARAEAYSKKALDYNRSNMDAMHLLAVLYRKQNDTPAYFETLRTIVTTDPLDHFAKFEQYYRGEAGITDSAFLSTIQNELPSETCIDLAAWYYRIGCLDEVKSLLRITPAGIEADAWKRYFSVPLTQRDTRHSIGAFPFREETAQLLMELMGRDKDWRLKYWLGLIYQSRSSNEKAKTLFIDCGDEPGDPDFYAARAALIPAHAETDLLRAISIDREQWRFYRYLVQYYLERGQNEKALSLAEDYYRQHQGNYMMGMLYAKTLLLNERFTDCDQVLSKLDIIPFEGATEGRQLYREAKLMEAIGAMKKKDYKEAQQYIGEARLWPENLGEGKPYEADIDERLEDWMDYQCCLQRKKTGEAARSLQKIIQFNLKTDNVLSTAYPANHLVTAWAMEKTGQAKKAIQWLDEKLKTDPANKILIWVKAVFDKKQMVPAPVNDATVRILQRLLEKAN